MQEVVLRIPCMTKNIIGNDIYNSHKGKIPRAHSLARYLLLIKQPALMFERKLLILRIQLGRI